MWCRELVNNKDNDPPTFKLYPAYLKICFIFFPFFFFFDSAVCHAVSSCSVPTVLFLPQLCLLTSYVSLEPDCSSTAGPPPRRWSPAVQLSSVPLCDECVSACANEEDLRSCTCVCFVSAGAAVCVCARAWQAVRCVVVLSLRLCLIAMHQRPCQ